MYNLQMRMGKKGHKHSIKGDIVEGGTQVPLKKGLGRLAMLTLRR